MYCYGTLHLHRKLEFGARNDVIFQVHNIVDNIVSIVSLHLYITVLYMIACL